MKNAYEIRVKTGKNLDADSFGRHFLQAWLEGDALLRPEKFAHGEPVRRSIELEGFESLVEDLTKQWPKISRYIEDGRIAIDTNLAENATRPFARGRRAWLFADTVSGAKASAMFYSLVETAKANGLEPYAYLRRLFERLPHARTVADYEAPLPFGAFA